MKKLRWMLLFMCLLTLSACPEDDDDGDGGGGSGSQSSIQLSRVGNIADGGTDALGAVSTLAAASTLTYTISNPGTAALNLAGGPAFVVASAESNILGVATVTQPATGVIAGGANATFDVDFQVAAAGAFSFVLTLTTDADQGQTGSTFEFTVSGTGDNSTRILTVERNSAGIADGGTDALGNVDASAAAPTLTYDVLNGGTGPMSFTGSAPFVAVAASPAPVNIVGGAAGITITGPASTSIAASGAEDFDVDFQVAAAGPFSFTIVFGTDATSGQTGPTFEINVSGTGTVPSRNLAARRAFVHIADGGTLDLGNRGWGVTSHEVRIELENAGTDPTTLTGSSPWVTVAASPAPVNITGTPTIVQPSSATIAPAGGVFFTFTFEVTALGSFSFTLQVGSNATVGQTGPTYEINVSGQGHPSFSFEKQFPTASTEPYANGVDNGTAEIRLVAGGFANGGTQFPNMEPSLNGRYLAYSFQPNAGGGNDNRHLYVVSATGGASVQVTPNVTTAPRGNIAFVWGQNAAGDQLLCVMSDAQSSANDKRIYTCVISGSPPTVNSFTEVTGWGTVSPTRKAFTAKWSPDGTRLAFQLFTPVAGSPQRELWACAFSGGLPGTATDMRGSASFTNAEAEIGGNANDYVWANASTLLYCADGDTQFVYQLYAVNVSEAGGVLTPGLQVKQFAYAAAESTSNHPIGWDVSPNGARVALIRVGSGIDHVFVASINTATTPATQQLTSGITTQANANAQRLAWAPDSLGVAFSGDMEVDDVIQLYFQALTTAAGAVALSGTTTRLSDVPAGFNVVDIQFSPEGRRILYEQHDQNNSIDQLVIVLISATPTRVTIASGFTNPTANLIWNRWKPGTGDFIATNADIDSSARELHVIPLGGPDLMTPGTRFTASGSFFSGMLSNYRWIP